MLKFEVEEILSWRNLKLKKFEVEEIWSEVEGWLDGYIGFDGPMTSRVKVWGYPWGLASEIRNFAYRLGLKTIH